MERGLRTTLAAVFAIGLLAVAGNAAAGDGKPDKNRGGGGGSRDDTATLQKKLDAGGKISLGRLPKNACYQTKGLWVSKNNTTITLPTARASSTSGQARCG